MEFLKSVDKFLGEQASNELKGYIFYSEIQEVELNVLLKHYGIYQGKSSEILNKFFYFKVLDNLYLLLYLGNIQDLKSKFSSISSVHYPLISKIFIKGYKLFNFMKYLGDNCSSVFITRIHAKAFSYFRIDRKKRTRIEYPQEEWVDFIDDFNSDFYNVISVDSHIAKANSHSIFHINNDGYFKIKRSLSLFYEYLAGFFVLGIKKDLLRLINRNRAERDNYKPKPIVIKYSDQIFADTKNFDILNKSISKKDRCISCYHSNPYFHANILQYTDGSSIDIKITSPDEISLIPQLKCTAPFISEIIFDLSGIFKLGEINFG